MCGYTEYCFCWEEIIHDECGLNIELCLCPDSTVKVTYDKEED